MASRRLPRLRSFASSGSSGPKMSWPATCGGPITAIRNWLNAIKIEHHKTGGVVWHPLEEVSDRGVEKFYEEAEGVLSHFLVAGCR